MDSSKALDALKKWLAARVAHDWETMAALTSSSSADVGGLKKLVFSQFSTRALKSFDEPKFINGRITTPKDDVEIGWADFHVQAALANGKGVEISTPRVIGIGGVWKVNALAALRRRIEPVKV